MEKETKSNDAGTQQPPHKSPGEFARNLLGNAASNGQFGFVRGLFNAITLLLALYVLPFIRFDYGRRVLSIWFLGIAWFLLGILGMLDLFIHRVPGYGNSYVSYFFGLHTRIWLALLVIHYWRIWRDIYRRKIARYSYSYGESMLFGWWVKLGQSETIIKVRNWSAFKELPGGSIWIDEAAFQQFIEPAGVILFGLWLNTTTDSFYPGFLILCGLALAYKVFSDSETLRGYQDDIVDAQIIGRMTIPDVRPTEPAPRPGAGNVGRPSGAAEIAKPPILADKSPISASENHTQPVEP